MSDELSTAIEAAKKGAEVALKYYETDLKIKYKEGQTPVTIADKATEEAIRNTIFSSHPNAKFLGEEGGGNINEKEVWLIDSIDATQNYMRKIPIWGIEIALVRNGVAYLGVSYAPLLSELLYVEKSQGAYCNNEKISVSKTTDLVRSFIVHGAMLYFDDKLDALITLLRNVKRERGFGDFYGHHLVATGRADAMIDAKNQPWDVAALSVIIKEAGGRITNFKGKPWQLHNSDVVASSSLIHNEIIAFLNKT